MDVRAAAGTLLGLVVMVVPTQRRRLRRHLSAIGKHLDQDRRRLSGL